MTVFDFYTVQVPAIPYYISLVAVDRHDSTSKGRSTLLVLIPLTVVEFNINTALACAITRQKMHFIAGYNFRFHVHIIHI